MHAPKDLLIHPHDATQTVTSDLVREPIAAIPEHGKGEVNNASTWDEFPNGRFGDFKSPAFGMQSDPWNAGLGMTVSNFSATFRCYTQSYLSLIQRAEAIARWGNPKSVSDLTDLFLSHLHAKVTSTPFSPTTLSPESLTILTHLERLTKRGWWTVFSQPAVDGMNSSDETFGWGPAGGYVYQKGFVEFFAEKSDVEKLEERIKNKGGGWVDFFAANAEVH